MIFGGGYAVAITLAGALGGFLAFLAFGKFFVPDWTWTALALKGLKVGGILAGVWAPGVAIVLCFIRGHRLNREARGRDA